MLMAGATAAIAGPLAKQADFVVDNAVGAGAADAGPGAFPGAFPGALPGAFDVLRKGLAALAESGPKIPAIVPDGQGHRGNTLLSIVSGNGNSVLARQIGTAQWATLAVSGDKNRLAVLQSGAGNTVAAAQTGNGNSMVVIQRQ